MTAQTILPANTLSSGGYQVDNSARFDGAYHLVRSKGGSETGLTKGTFSFWVKRTNIDGTQHFLYSNTVADSNNRGYISWRDSEKIRIITATNNSSELILETNQFFRDTSAWYHIVYSIDTTQSTAANRAKLYVNGTQVTSFSTATYMDQNSQCDIFEGGQTNKEYIGGMTGDTSNLHSYLSEYVYIDGLALAADQFGEFDDSGIWIPIDVSGLTFGNEGFYLDFQTSAELGDDVSGNTNDFTESNLNAVHQSTDTCTNNFSTFNGTLKQMSTMVLTEGNLQGATSSSHEAFFGSFFSSIGVTTGKWYAEFKCTGNANRVYVGISNNLEEDVHGSTTVGGKKAFTFAYKGNGWAYYGADGKIAHTNSDTFLSYGAALSNNDIVGVALDLDELEIYFSINGSFQNSGDPTSGSSQTGGVVTAGGAALTTGANSGTYYFCVSDNDQSTVCTVQANFGSPIHSISSGNADGNGFGNFEYAVPSGYLALCTKNLAENG